MEQATKYMSGDKYSSMSLMIATLSGIVIKIKIIKIKIQRQENNQECSFHQFFQLPLKLLSF